METLKDIFDGISTDNIKSFCGVQWYKEAQDFDRPEEKGGFTVFFIHLRNDSIGEIIIDRDVMEFINQNEDLHYKILSLIYEQHSLGKICSIAANDKTPLAWKYDEYYLSCTLDDFLKRFPGNFMETQERSLLLLYYNYPNYGQQIKKFEPYHLFAKDNIGMGFILKSLIEKELISGEISQNGDGTYRLKAPYQIAMQGWIQIEKSMHSIYSKQVFVAMSFAPEMNKVRETIRKAVEAAGLNALIIDEVEHINYIPVEIQSKIKQSGLMVADLTTQNHGAYFEAGFAMGQNIPVVWCCKDDDSENLHFDIRQYNNILWQDEEDLYKRLKNRLVALQEMRV
jgi:nucleoside 2-deoxyribosyltransferase